MKWIFVCIGIAMVTIGGVGKYVDVTKYKEDFISGNSPFYTIFMTGIITIILGLSFDWILSLDDEDEGEGDEQKDEDEGGESEDESGEQADPEAAESEGEPEAEEAEALKPESSEADESEAPPEKGPEDE